ncbi:hypothetical protein [Streptomyces sp. NPDC051286]|uniref:hypothetical protein n=1 Tax=Streptomyces sp. NPDC051286 TaxID=3365647 RepID=UPI0037A04FC9
MSVPASYLFAPGPYRACTRAVKEAVVAALVIGLVYGAVLRATKPTVHARIGLGNEAFQLEKAAESGAVHH